MCYIDVDDPCEVWSETWRRARKEHRCAVCLRLIYSGERYSIHFSVYQGEPCSKSVCSFCQTAREEFAEAHEGATYQPGSGFLVMLSECIAEGDEESEERWQPMLEEIRGRRASRERENSGSLQGEP